MLLSEQQIYIIGVLNEENCEKNGVNVEKTEQSLERVYRNWLIFYKYITLNYFDIYL